MTLGTGVGVNRRWKRRPLLRAWSCWRTGQRLRLTLMIQSNVQKSCLEKRSRIGYQDRQLDLVAMQMSTKRDSSIESLDRQW